MITKLRLSKKWVMVGVILSSLLIGAGVAYGANSIIVKFGGDLGIDGTVKIIAPPPEEGELEIVSTPDFEYTIGQPDNPQGEIVVRNNSAAVLTFKKLVAEFEQGKDVGLIEVYGEFDETLQAYSDQLIPVMFTIDSKAIAGEYQYSGSIEYTY